MAYCNVLGVSSIIPNVLSRRTRTTLGRLGFNTGRVTEWLFSGSWRGGRVARIHDNLKQEIAKDLPGDVNPTAALDIDSRNYRILILSHDALEKYKTAFLHRKAVLRSHALHAALMKECNRKEVIAQKTSTKLASEIDSAVKRLKDQSADGSVRGDARADLQNRRMRLHEELNRSEKLREDNAAKRAMLMATMLEQHLTAWMTQTSADEAHMRSLEENGLIAESSRNFQDTWELLSGPYREDGLLEDRLATVKLWNFEDSSVAGGDVWDAFARDYASYFSALVGHEAARADVAYAKQNYEYHRRFGELQQEVYHRARVARHSVLTP